MRALALLFLLLLNLQTFGGDTTYNVVTVNGKKGLKDAQGNFVILPKYDEIGWTDGTSVPSDGVIGFQEFGHWGLINVRNERLTAAKYTHLLPFKNQTFIASIKGKFSDKAFYGVVSEKGKSIIDFKYYSLNAMNGYLIALSKFDYPFVYGLLDEHGQLVLDFKYKTIHRVSDHLVKAKLDHNSIKLFNTTSGNPLVGNFSAITPYNSKYSFVQMNNLVGLLESSGELVIAPQYELLERKDNKEWRGKNITKWFVLNDDYELIEEINCQELSFQEDRLKTSSLRGEELLNKEFKRITPHPFDQIIKISGSKILFKDGEEYGVYDLSKHRYLKGAKFDTAYVADEFIYGAKLFHNKLKWALYDTFGVKRTHFDYDMIRTYKNRLFAVQKRGHWGFINRAGKEVIHCVYNKVGAFKDGLVVVEYHRLFGIINNKNEWIVLPQKGELSLINSTLYLNKMNTTTKLLSTDGQLIYFTDNPIALKKGVLIESLTDEKQQMISLEGVFVNRKNELSHTYDNVKYYEDEMVAVKRGGKYGFVDRQHRLRITNRYEDVGRYNELGIPVKLLGKWGMINTQEEITVQPIYDSIYQSVNGLSIVIANNLKGLINSKGEEFIKPQLNEITQLENGEYLVKVNNKYGLVGANGKWLINAKYDELTKDNNVIIVKKRNLYGTLTLEGVEAIPNIYNQIYYHKNWHLYFAKLEGEWETIEVH